MFWQGIVEFIQSEAEDHSLLPHTIMQLFILGISLVLFVVYAALILYYAISWTSIPAFKPVMGKGDKQLTLTIIIPARNEEQKIGACLNSVCSQQYPAHLYEVLVVDDHSTDNTANIVKKYAGKNVQLISLKDELSGGILNAYKKKAIEVAVARANGELIIATDADCIVNENWLNTIAAFHHKHNAAFIAMPVTYDSSSTFIEIFQSLDFMTLQGITGASVHKKIHSMCNGANLAYTKKAFEDVNGFKDIDNIASGDDMLLMHKIYNQQPEKVFFLKSKEVIVQTAPMKTIKDFFNQRIRWASKADKFEDKRIFAVLLMVYLFNVLLLVLPVVSLFKNYSFDFVKGNGNRFQLSLFQFWLLLLTGKTIIELIFLYPVARFFKKSTLLWLFPVAQPFHIVYTVIAGWLGKFGSYEWKERKVK